MTMHTSTTDHAPGSPLAGLSTEALRVLELVPRWALREGGALSAAAAAEVPRSSEAAGPPARGGFADLADLEPPRYEAALAAWLNRRAPNAWSLSWAQSAEPSAQPELSAAAEPTGRLCIAAPSGAWLASAAGRRWLFEQLAPLRSGPRR